MSAALPAFDYQRLDAFKVARELCALATHSRAELPVAMPPYRTNTAARSQRVPCIAEASSRQGADRLCRFRCGARRGMRGRGRAWEGVLVLNLAPEAEILTLLALLDRLCAMLTRLAHMGERPSGPAQIGPRARER